MNPYYSCVSKKQVAGSKLIVLWHVDNLKVSHADPNKVPNYLQLLNTTYEKNNPITITWGKKHNYLGMILGYTTKGEVKLSMIDYIDTTIKEAGE